MTHEKLVDTENRLNAHLTASGSIQIVSAGTVVNPTSDTTLGTFTVPALDMPLQPDFSAYEFVIFGRVAFGVLSPVLTFKMFATGAAGTGVIFSSGSSITCNSGGATARQWTLRGTIIVGNTGAFGEIFCEAAMMHQIAAASSGTGTAAGPVAGSGDVSVDTTAPWSIYVTASFSSSSGTDTAIALNGLMWRRF